MAEKIKFNPANMDAFEELPADLNDPEVKEAFAHLLLEAEKPKQEKLKKEKPVKDDIDELKFPPLTPKSKKIIGAAMKPSPLIARFPDMITSSLESATSLDRSIADWRPILTKECQVYVIDQQYIGKRFDQVHYKYMNVDEAEEVLKDNLYAILLYKYFPQITDESLKRIDDIVKGLTKNIKTFLTKISFEGDTNHFQGLQMKRVPNSAVAFANGIFDFVKNDFIVKYERIYIPAISNTIILYNDYIIEWDFDFDFEPLPINITETSFEEFIDIMRALDEDDRNYCWELFYNMTHDNTHRPSIQRMQHLAEIFGYTLIPQFLQYFILLIGSGQNGKNSLFDGCFSARVNPRPVSNSIESIEKDRFITESLENACHNIFLETSAKTYTDSNMLKALTGSMYQTIECKGVGKYAGVINCKYVFAGNDQSKIKFADTTVGFRRRINIFEIFYSWDPDHRFMKRGDYYSTDFSGDLHEIKNDIRNTICYIYLGMYGILSATKNFTRDFKFSFNEWTDSYADIDINIKQFFGSDIRVEDYFSMWGDTRYLDEDHQKLAFFCEDGSTRLYNQRYLKEHGAFTYPDAVKFFNGSTPLASVDTDGNEIIIQDSNAVQYLRDHDIYISMIYLKALLNRNQMFLKSQREFNDMFRKIYPQATYISCAQREQYVKGRLSGNKLIFADK